MAWSGWVWKTALLLIAMLAMFPASIPPGNVSGELTTMARIRQFFLGTLGIEPRAFRLSFCFVF